MAAVIMMIAIGEAGIIATTGTTIEIRVAMIAAMVEIKADTKEAMVDIKQVSSHRETVLAPGSPLPRCCMAWDT
jgi:hypothetical protein